MSDVRQRDWAPFFHIGVGMALFVGLGAARSFGLFDLGAGGNMGLLLFPALIFVIGQPRGHRGWLVATSAALLVIVVGIAGVPALRWMAGGKTSLKLLATIAGAVIGILGVAAARHQSEPVPERSPANPKAWKPITRWGVLSGLVLGAVVFAATLLLWDRWADAHAEIAFVRMVTPFPQAFLAGFVAAVTVIYCRPSDWHTTELGVLAGFAMAVLAGGSLMGGVSVVLALAPDRGIFQAMQDALIFSAALLIPAAYAAAWALGRRPAGWVEPEGSAP